MNDAIYIIKSKSARVPNKTIASKLNITEAELERRWNDILKDFEKMGTNGYQALCDSYTVLCHQYQLLGESLKIISSALANVMTSEELEKLVVEDRKITLENLKRSCIVFRPFIPITPSESLEKSTRKN